MILHLRIEELVHSPTKTLRFLQPRVDTSSDLAKSRVKGLTVRSGERSDCQETYVDGKPATSDRPRLLVPHSSPHYPLVPQKQRLGSRGDFLAYTCMFQTQ